MKLTPLDIRKQDFTKGFRGYEEHEVRAFLETVSDQWQEISDEHRRLEDKIRELELKLVHYQNVEDALQEALNTAKMSSQQKIADAERRAKAMLEEAQGSAEAYKRSAVDQKHRLNVDVARLNSRRSEIVARLRAFLQSELEMLTYFANNDPIGVSPGAITELPEAQPSELDAPITVHESHYENQIDLTPIGPDVSVDQPQTDTPDVPEVENTFFADALLNTEPPVAAPEPEAHPDAVVEPPAAVEETPDEKPAPPSPTLEQLGTFASAELTNLANEIYRGDDVPAPTTQPPEQIAENVPADQPVPAAPTTWRLDDVTKKTAAETKKPDAAEESENLQSVTEDDIAKIRRILDNLR